MTGAWSDAGFRGHLASDAAVGMELGCDGILKRTPPSPEAKDPKRMAPRDETQPGREQINRVRGLSGRPTGLGDPHRRGGCMTIQASLQDGGDLI